MKSTAILIFAALGLFFGCSLGNEVSSSASKASEEGTSSIDMESFAESVGDDADTYDADDVVGDLSFDTDVYIDFSDKCVQVNSGECRNYDSSTLSLIDGDDGSLTLAVLDTGVTITSTLTSQIRYYLTGSLSGTLAVESEAAYELFLSGLTVSGSSGPAFDLESSEKVFIVTADGTENVLTDDEERADDWDMKASLYGKGPMVFSGSGSLTVNGDYKHGIYSKDYIRVREGELIVNVSARDGIRSRNGFIFDGGDLQIRATGSGLDEESKGIKVEGHEDTENPGKGYVVINGGTLDIESVSKGITASWEAEDDGETADTSDDPDPYVQINNGVITVSVSGTPYEYTTMVDGERTTVSCSPEGIEGKSYVEVNSGYIICEGADDCLNAGDSIEINGGYLYLVSSECDAIDSNGTLTLNGGVIVAEAAGAPEGAFDCDNNTFSITGGTIIGIGGSSSSPSASSCTQNVLVMGSGSQGDVLGIVSSNGDTVFAYDVPSDYSSLLMTSPLFETGSTYIVYTDGTSGGNDEFYGLYLNSLTYAGGTGETSFTISSTVTSLK